MGENNAGLPFALAGSLNATQVTSPIQVVFDRIPFHDAPHLYSAARDRAPPTVVPPMVVETTPLQAVAQEEVVFRSDTVIGESRIIEIFKVNPDGSERFVFSDASDKLEELLQRLRRGAYLNGRYRVYLTVINLADNKPIEHRLLIEIYKSGTTLGDPVHEPGPGDRPLDDSPKTPERPKAEPQQPAGQTGNGKTPVFITPTSADHASMVPDWCPRDETPSRRAPMRALVGVMSTGKPPLSHAMLRYPLAAAAVAAMGGLGARSVQEAWASRVDQALGGDRTESLGRTARLRRMLRKSKS